MKHFFLLTIISFSLFNSNLAQAEDYKYNARISPLGFIFGSVNIGLDYAVDNHWLAGAAVSYFSLGSGETALTSYGLEARAQYNLKEVFTDTFYLAPYVGYSAASSVSLLSIGAIAGYSWIWDNFNLQTGVGFRHLSISSTGDSDYSTLAGLIAAVEFNIGYAF